MQISTAHHESALTAIPVIVAAKPIITQIGIDSLRTTAADKYQWFRNDEYINGATNQGYKIPNTIAGNALYKVSTTIGTCTNYSDNALILVTDVPQAPSNEIGLKILSTDYIENMIKGNQFFIQFNNIKTNTASVSILNSVGETVFQKEKLNNQTTPQSVQIPTLNSGIYFVKVFANNKVYVQRVFITNN